MKRPSGATVTGVPSIVTVLPGAALPVISPPWVKVPVKSSARAGVTAAAINKAIHRARQTGFTEAFPAGHRRRLCRVWVSLTVFWLWR